MTNKFTFSKKLRLLNNKEFQYVFQKATTYKIKPMTILVRYNHYQYPRIGIIITKSYVKLANKRNTIKRIIRENFRMHQHKLPNIDFIIMIQKKMTKLDNSHINTSLKKLWSIFQ